MLRARLVLFRPMPQVRRTPPVRRVRFPRTAMRRLLVLALDHLALDHLALDHLAQDHLALDHLMARFRRTARRRRMELFRLVAALRRTQRRPTARFHPAPAALRPVLRDNGDADNCR
jgi:hypothetical protein